VSKKPDRRPWHVEAGFCQVVLVGLLAGEPKVMETRTGKLVVFFVVRVTRFHGRRYIRHYIRCRAFGGPGRRMAEWGHRESRVLVAGRLDARIWIDEEGKRHFREQEVVATWVQFQHKAGVPRRPVTPDRLNEAEPPAVYYNQAWDEDEERIFDREALDMEEE